MSKVLLQLIICSILIISGLQAQSFQGPALGSSKGGVTQTTDFFPKTIALGQPKEFFIGNEETEYKDTPEYFNFAKPSPPEGSNYYIDKTALNKSLSASGGPILFNSFNGINMTNSIPPDPNLAAGPNHIIATVNTAFSIWDKSGNKLKTIDGSVWVKQIIPLAGTIICDPKITYDHFNNRWIMVWLTENTTLLTSYWTISVSKDSSALGTWYSWATPCNFNGPDSTNNLGDYEGVGFDKDCIYLTGNQFDITSGHYQYSKIRIIPKAQLYANTAGPITWWDFWNITIPGSSSSANTLRPTYVWGAPDAYYLIQANGAGANFLSLYKITTPVIAPVLTGVRVPCTNYGAAGNADQLGGSFLGSTEMLIETGGSAIKNEAKYRDGYLWATHIVRNPVDPLYTSIHYVKIDVNTNTTVEDVVFGGAGTSYFYPAIVVDQNHNMAITFSRSGDNEYVGSYYTFKLSTDPPGLSSSALLQSGKGNYVLDYSGGRNRWGDYSGICIDPADPNNLWMISEFASGKNIWATYIGGLRLVPYSGLKLTSNVNSIDFGNVELGKSSNVYTAMLKNYGTTDINITSISVQKGPFSNTDNLSFPIKLSSYDSLVLHYTYTPTQLGNVQDTFIVTNNDPNFSRISVTGKGYKIDAANPSTFYASSGTNNTGNILTINPSTGAGSNIGASLYPAMTGIAVNPKTKVIYGISTYTDSTEFVRINASAGDAYNLFTAPVGTMAGIAFDTSGTLYAAYRNGLIYSVNLGSKTMVQVCSTKVKLGSITFDSKTNELWGSPYITLGANKDMLFKINTATGDTANVGKTGFNILTNCMSFDEQGNLFGATGTAAASNNYISINKTTGAGTIVGSIGLNNITGMSYSSQGPSAVNSETVLPLAYSLMQNYPNPFNPSTTIEYSIPKASNVKITIYNILGEVMELLDNSFHQAGNYKVTWNPGKIASGVYFYELKAVSSSGDDFSQMKKMIMLK
jgi:hypothetical protein